MDKQLEEKIRGRAYELWMQHGCLPDRADAYWYQAEQEVLGAAGQDMADDLGGQRLNDEGSASSGIAHVASGGAPSESDEGLADPVAPKTRKRRNAASGVSSENSDVTGGAPKRRRSVRVP